VILTEADRLFPYNGFDYPYHRGICDAADDPRIQELVLVAGTQVGKSVLGRSWLLCRIATDPANSIFATSIEKLARGTARDQLWPMFRECAITRPWCPRHVKGEATDVMRLTSSTIRVAWSGSPTTLGDWTAKYGLAGEFDKWSREVSDEADPGLLFDKRFGAAIDYQWMKEGTPTFKETSRLWRLLLTGSNARYNVPCPRCNGYQELVLGNGQPKTPGIIWDKDKDGKNDPLIALQTARYRCGKCHREWEEEQRMPSVRRGVWVPEGCYVSETTGKVRGQPLRPYPRASFQISRLYSPRTSWGQLAREYVECDGQPELLRDYYNSTLGLPWEQRRKRATWEEVAERLSGRHDLGICPEGAIFVTCGVDVQLAHLVYLVSAWGQRATGWCLGLGICQTFSELRDKILDVSYAHADGGQPLPIEMTLIDSRYREDEVFEFCESVDQVGRHVWPYKGAKAGQLQGRPYRKISPRDPDAQGRLSQAQRVDDFYQVTGNTNWWQSWADKCLYERHPGDETSYTFHASAVKDEDLFTQLTNEIFDPHSAPPKWEKIASSACVDFRDCWRMSRTAAEVNLLGAWHRLGPRVNQKRPRAPQAPVVATQDPPKSKGGWIRKPPARRTGRRR